MASCESGQSIELKTISNKSDVEPQATFPPSQWRPAAKKTPAEEAKRESHGSITTAQNALIGFAPSNDEEREQRRERAIKAKREREGHKKVLEDFRRPTRDVIDSQTTSSSTSFFNSIRRPRQQALTKDNLAKLIKVAHDAFRPRMDLPVLVCDVKMDSGTIYEVQLKDIEHCWKQRPDDIIIRWIHAPLGHGVVHSSIEDMFRHDQPRGRPFRNAGHPGFPFLDLDAPHLRDINELKHMRHVHKELHELKELHDVLTETCFDNDRNVTFADDVSWRLRHLGKVPDYWDTVLGDVPLELTESFGSGGGEGPLRPPSLGKGPLDPSVLAYEKDGPFQDTHLVWAPFRCFHRSDGTLLTMSAATGVDLLHRDFKSHLEQTPLDRLRNPDASVIGSQMKALKANGAKGWYQLTVEYFLVHLLTEIGITPHNMYSGHSAPSLLSALRSIIRDLKKRRFERWDNKESEKLVKDYIICLDQLRALSAAYERRLTFFENLARDVKEHEEQDRFAAERKLKTEQKLVAEQTQAAEQPLIHNREISAVDRPEDLGEQREEEQEEAEDEEELRRSMAWGIHNQKGTTPDQRVAWALRINRHHKKLADSLVEETERALQAFFQLRSIEQNERAINNESRNYAIFIFTAVTVVFLPLSFFCSYFGMNLKGVKNTARSESWFWELGGSLTVVIVSVIALCAFARHFWSERFVAAKAALKNLRTQFRDKDPESQAPLG